MSRTIIAACVLLAVALVNGQVLPVSFCERYSAALFTNSSTSTQQLLINSVLNRALFGGVGGGVTVVGILNQPLQMPYFNGTAPGTSTNYYTNTVARNSLIAKLQNFFCAAMQCRAVTTTQVANMNSIHVNMMIGAAVFNQFVSEVGNTLVSFGVPNSNLPTADLPYAVALLSQFNKGAPQAICTAADCATYSAFAEFFVFGAPGSFRWFAADGATPSVSIPVGGTVHWNFATIHNVVQTDSTFTNLAGGWTSGATGLGTSSFLQTFTTAGTYYFVCNPHRATMQASIIVGAAAASSTGGSGSGRTAEISSAVAVVAAAAALVLAIRRF